MNRENYDLSLEVHESDHHRNMEIIYNHLLELLLSTWQMMNRGQDEFIRDGAITPEEKVINSRAEYDGTLLKIIVEDILPRLNTVSASLKRYYWDGHISGALKKLGTTVHFNRALCIIRIYAPKNTAWDVDNRAISFVINSLRTNGVIPGDEWYNMALVQLGGIDREHPRTEISVREYPGDIIEYLANGRQYLA
jgi:hypothetical protein